MKRNIILIDEEKCNGCGLCVPNCAEGSLEIRDGKAVLVKDALCDGLGACLGHCPEGALTIIEREADPFDEELVNEHLKEIGREPLPHGEPQAAPPQGGCPSAGMINLGGGCPSAQAAQIKPEAKDEGADAGPSQLSHWPVQLTLLPPTAPFFEGANLVLAADCVPFAYPNFHRDFLKGNAVAVACPKLDDAEAHYRKLVDVFKQGGLSAVTVVRMEVPCCGGLVGLASQALKDSGAGIPFREVVVGRDGSIVSDSA